MKKSVWLLLLSTLAAVYLLAGCTSIASPQPEVNPAVVALLTEQAMRWDEAIVRKDRAAIERNMSEDFRQIDGAGDIETKSSFVEGLVSPELQIDPYTVEDFEVRLYGGTALLSGRTRMTGTFKNKAFVSHYRYIDVYVHRDGRWQVVSVQISKLPQ